MPNTLRADKTRLKYVLSFLLKNAAERNNVNFYESEIVKVTCFISEDE
jgi:hypothetical protein